MEFTSTYIMSQIFVVCSYIFLVVTYFFKDRNRILVSNFISLVLFGISYFLLSAYTGIAMILVAIIRNIIFIYDENKYGKTDKITKKDVFILILLYVISIIFTVFTYEDFFSLLSVFATMLYTYSVWQKDTKVYKSLGIPIGMLWIGYNIYISSIFGIILESVLFVSVIIGIIVDFKKKDKV